MAKPSAFGVALKVQRETRKWSQRELERKAGLKGGYISKLESGAVQWPGTDQGQHIAAVFGMTPDKLMGISRPSPEPPTPSPFGSVVMIQVVNISLAAGSTVYGETRETVPIPAELVAGRSLVAARVAGDCMEPEIMAGDVAIVDIADRSPRPGHLVAVLLEDGGMAVKRVSKDDEGPVLLDNKGGSYRPNGATVQGTIVSVVRNYR